MAMQPFVCLSTAQDQNSAQLIARTLVEERLCACVNIIPGVTSVYYWKGKIQSDQEVLMVMKSADESPGGPRLLRLERRLKELHTYETPEFVALPIAHVSESYLQWLLGVCAMGTDDDVPPKPIGI